MIGRERELALLAERLRPGETIALVGPSGVGKTAIAEEVVRRFDGASRFVDCFGMEPATAALAVAEAAEIAIDQSPADALWVRAAEALDDVGLVVLDDVGFDLDQLQLFCTNFAHGAVLITCHAASDEVVRLPLQGLEIPALGDFADSDACELFLDAARRANLTFEVGVDELETVYEIARRMDGYPLALCLAGRRAASTSPATVLELLDQAETLSDPTRPARHASLQAALQFSWDGLSASDQRRMYLMSLFSRPLPPRMLAELGGETLEQCLDGIHALVGRGLVTGGRFPRPLESFVAVSIEQFEAHDPEEAQQLVQQISRRAFDLARVVPTGLSDLSELRGDEPSLWQFVLDRDDHELADEELSTVLAAWLRWATVRGLTFERLAISPRIQQHIEQLNNWAVWFALARQRSGDPTSALEAVKRADQVASSDNERQELHLLRGYLLVQLGQVDDAFADFDAARALGELLPLAHVFISEALLMDGKLDEARGEIAMLDGRDGEFGVVTEAYIQTLRAWLAPTPHDALREQQRAVELCVASGQLRGEAAARQALAMLLAHRFARYADALDELDRTRAISEKTGDYRFANRARASAVAVLVLQGSYEVACSIAEEVVGTGDPAIDDYCYLLWLIARWQLGDRDVVREEWAKKELTEPPAAVPRQDTAWTVFDVAVALSHDPGLAASLARQHSKTTPEVEVLLDALIKLATLTPAADFKSVLETWRVVREVRAARDGSLGVELCWRLLQEDLTDEMRRFDALEELDAPVRVLDDYQALLVDGDWFDLSTQPVSQRLLEILVEADEPLDHHAVGAALYPDEIVVEDAMKNRIDVQVSKLRKLGLRPFLAKRPEGFVLEGEVVVASS